MTNEGLYLPDIIGGGYRDFWWFQGRYRVIKGGRASKKSKTTALNLIIRIMENPGANALIIRKVYRTLKDSCFAELRWAINRLGVQRFWDVKYSTLEMTYLPTGQRIFFRGLDDPMKIASITVVSGALCWMWIEEAYEIMDEVAFDMLDESIRGALPPGLFKQLTLTFNPWNERHWLKARFFDRPNPDVLTKTTNYLCNEFIDEADRRLFEEMKQNNPRRYKVAGLGEWGTVEGLVFENWKEESFDLESVIEIPGVLAVYGLDFGYTNDPTALFCGLVDNESKTIFVYDEIYEKGLSNEAIAKRLAEKELINQRIIADSSEPKSIDRLRELGVRRIRPAVKGPGSVMAGIDFLQDYRIVVHPRCVNFITEISNYSWDKDDFGNLVNKPQDDFNHLMDAMRYATCEMRRKPREGLL